MQEQLDDKASKSSVAEALHRKVSKQDFDDGLSKKAELTDIERIFKSVDMKVDLNTFHEMKAAIDAKADKYEIEGLQKVPNFEADSRMQQWASEKMELDRRISDMEHSVMRIAKEQDSEVENLRQQLLSSLQTKADYRDIDTISQKMHSKAEIDKVQGIISDFRQEVKSTISQSKKESQSFTKRQDEEVKNLR